MHTPLADAVKTSKSLMSHFLSKTQLLMTP